MRGNLPFFIHILVPPEFHCYQDVINKCVITNNVDVVYMTSDPSIDPFKEQRRNLNWANIYKSLNFPYNIRFTSFNDSLSLDNRLSNSTVS